MWDGGMNPIHGMGENALRHCYGLWYVVVVHYAHVFMNWVWCL